MDFLLTGRCRNRDGPAAVLDRRLWCEQYLDANLTGGVVENDGVLAEEISFCVERHGSNLSPADDVTKRDRNRPRGAVSAPERFAVMRELD